MMNLIVEAVVSSFMIGGIVGAIIGLQMKAKHWNAKQVLVYNEEERNRTRGR